MVLLVWPPAEHLWIGRNRGQFAPYDAARWPLRRTTLAEDPGSTRPERHFPSGAAQTRVVSAARIRLDPRKSVRSYKGIIYGGISEFESYMPGRQSGLLGLRPACKNTDTCVPRRSQRSRLPNAHVELRVTTAEAIARGVDKAD